MTPPRLNAFQRNVYTQFGEDGIIEEILNRVGHENLDGWCVEFGAWDGVHLSNTCNLIRNRNYKAVLIEGDARKHKELCANHPSDEIIKICRFVTFDGESTLDRILEQTPIPRDFDFLSIDIDGCDYFILDSLKAYQPKVVCIEFNPTIPNEVEFVQPKDFRIRQGCSARSLARLAREKGYSLAASTLCNLFFVSNRVRNSVIGPDEILIEALIDDSQSRRYVFSGYDGTVFLDKPLDLPWHELQISPDALQAIPKFLRKFRGDYNFFQRIAFWVFLVCRDPNRYLGTLRKRLFRN